MPSVYVETSIPSYHLANANKIQHLTVLNARLGLAVPIITTPLTLLPEVMP